MRILIAALADSANVGTPGDKLNLMGVFDTIGAASFPTIHPTAALALRLQFDYEDRNSSHKLEVLILNQDGREFGKIEGKVEIGGIAPGGRATANQIFMLQQLRFQAPDRFSIVLRWDGKERQRLPLDVVAIPAPPR